MKKLRLKMTAFIAALMICISFMPGKIYASNQTVNLSCGTEGSYEGRCINDKGELWYTASLENEKSNVKLMDDAQSIVGNFVITKKHRLYYIDYYGNTKLVDTHIKEVSASESHKGSLMLKTNGDVYILKSHGYEGRTSVPVLTKKKVMSGGKKVYSVTTYTLDEKNTFYVIKKDGSLWGWGENDYGQLATGDTKDVKKPRKIIDNVKDFCMVGHFGMSSSGYANFALKKDGSLYGWGYNDEFEIEPIEYDASVNYDVVTKPILVKENIKSVQGSSCLVTAVTTDGKLLAWGCYGGGWVGLTRYGADLSETEIVTGVKDSSTVCYNGSNIIYYITEDDELYAKYAEKLEEEPILCMKEVCRFDLYYSNQFAITNKGELYFCTAKKSGYKVYKNHILPKMKFATN